MPFHLPLAASDWGDYIFLIVIMVGAFIKWLIGLKSKSPETHKETDAFGGPRQEPAGDSAEPTWDDLMEALGQKKASVPRSIPAYAPPPQPPPPLPRAPVEESAPLARPFRTLADETPASPALSDHLKTLLASMDQPRPMGQSASPLSTPKAPHQVPTVTGRTNTRFGRLLHESGQVRRAIVLQEILQPPLALR